MSVATQSFHRDLTTLGGLVGLLPLVVAPGAGSELYRGIGAVISPTETIAAALCSMHAGHPSQAQSSRLFGGPLSRAVQGQAQSRLDPPLAPPPSLVSIMARPRKVSIIKKYH